MFVTFFFALSLPSAFCDDNPKKILIVASYHQTYPFTQDIIGSFLESDKFPVLNTQIDIEYMDFKIHTDRPYRDAYRSVFVMKYPQVTGVYGAVLTVDDDALRFLLSTYGELPPVVFTGLNEYRDDLIKPRRETVTGIMEVVDVAGTLDIAFRLQPDANTVYVILDDSGTGEAVKKTSFDPIIPLYEGRRFVFMRSAKYSSQEIYGRVAGIENAVIISSTWTRDRDGTYVEAIDFVRHVAKASASPVYVLNENKMGTGAVGGKVTSGTATGRAAADMVNSVFSGNRPSEIAILTASSNPYIFDYQELKRYNLDVALLPADAKILNLPPRSFLRRYWRQTLIAFFVVIAETSVLIGLIFSIRRRKRAEDDSRESEKSLKEFLQEKNALLREIHHRVKNNMQIVSSILNLETHYVEDPGAKDAINQCQSRIQTMALIHEQLYGSTSFAKLRLDEFLPALVSKIVSSFSVAGRQIQIEYDLVDLEIEMGRAIPCGLIVNEMVTNSFKYAFPDKRGGRISLGLKFTDKNQISLRIADNGIGFPENFDIEKDSRLGLTLVQTLAYQLSATYRISGNSGVHFNLSMPLQLK